MLVLCLKSRPVQRCLMMTLIIKRLLIIDLVGCAAVSWSTAASLAVVHGARAPTHSNIVDRPNYYVCVQVKH